MDATAVADLSVVDGRFGYDITDYTEIEPLFGPLAELDRPAVSLVLPTRAG